MENDLNAATGFTPEQIERDRRVLELLSQNFGSIQAASTEIINLEAILNLPKGTEHFVADLHGEDEAFRHILKNASGNIKRKVHEIYGNTMRDSELSQLCSLIYYPEQKLDLIAQEEKDLDNFYNITLHRLVKVLQTVSSKYTRSKVRKALPPEFAYIIEELLHEAPSEENKQMYYARVVETIISCGQANEFIIAICNVIQRLTIDRLHIIGDIFDRGPGPHIILDTLTHYHLFDIQWGNHDMLWMGAAAGNLASIANVLRLSARYANLDVLEDGYGINLLPLARFAMETYADDPCTAFQVVELQKGTHSARDLRLLAQMHKAIAILQFKLEGELILRHPEYEMNDRLLLGAIDFERGTIRIDGKEHELTDKLFPTVDPADPYRLSVDEQEVVNSLLASFRNCEKLQKHIRLLYAKGGLYLILNSNLMYHASIPMTEEGEFREVTIDGHTYSGKALLDRIDRIARKAYFGNRSHEGVRSALDYMWYLWCGPCSPLFDKDRMTTFERYFIADKATHKETKGAYYRHMEDAATCRKILEAFGLDPETSHIISGHIPVKSGKGESPIKAEGKLLMIDGGFSKAYQAETGIAGYTLIFNSHGLYLVQHQPFETSVRAIVEGRDIISTRLTVETAPRRLTVRDTTIGKELQVQIDDLKQLLAAFRTGQIKERK